MKTNKKSFIYITPTILVYMLIALVSANFCYFWDSIQQISKEAHWFYLTDFKSFFIPAKETFEGISGTGYHPPLIGIMTAALWKIFGYHLWVSHIFLCLWAIILFYNTIKLIRIFFPEKYLNWVLAIVLLESTLLAQFAIASPDFILFTAFVISVRAMLDQKKLLLTVGIFFLCCINMRGVFVGVILCTVHNYYIFLLCDGKYRFKSFINTILPYVPTLLILVFYFTSYFMLNGWFFNNPTYASHYSMPTGFARIIKHLAEFGLRSIENGRFIVWIMGIVVITKFIKAKSKLKPAFKALFLLFVLLNGLYVIFIFISQMPFSARYFMPQFFLLTLISLYGVIEFADTKKIKTLFALVLFFELTGHFWIYPEKIAKSWDCTLAHLSYYELRNDCFNYIESHKLSYDDISAGFCLYGNRRFIDLKPTGGKISVGTNSRYFIYSNISNIEDDVAATFNDRKHWTPMKKFEKWPVSIIIYQNNFYKK